MSTAPQPPAQNPVSDKGTGDAAPTEPMVGAAGDPPATDSKAETKRGEKAGTKSKPAAEEKGAPAKEEPPKTDAIVSPPEEPTTGSTEPAQDSEGAAATDVDDARLRAWRAKTMAAVMGDLAGQGKLGSVEIKDLAAQMAKLAANGESFEGDGAPKVGADVAKVAVPGLLRVRVKVGGLLQHDGVAYPGGAELRLPPSLAKALENAVDVVDEG